MPPREVRCKFCRKKFFRPYHTAIKYCSSECKLATSNGEKPALTTNSLNNIKQSILDLYANDYSAKDIKERLGLKIHERSIQRYLKSLGVIRSVKDSYLAAIRQGKITWEHQRNNKKFKHNRKAIKTDLRYEVLKRDNFKCILCGKGSVNNMVLEVDHIIRQEDGGLNELNNLRTLCSECNLGRWVVEQRVIWKEKHIGKFYKNKPHKKT